MGKGVNNEANENEDEEKHERGRQARDEYEEEEEDEDEKEDDNDGDHGGHGELRAGPCWRKWSIEYDKANHDNPREDYGWVDDGEAFDNHRLWKLLHFYDRNCALISAGANSKGEVKREDGIVEGHAYTIKHVFSF